jgi:Icc protein
MKKTITYITDIHLDEKFSMDNGVDARKNWNIILADINQRQIDEVIFGGDIGEAAANKYFWDTG